MRWIVRDAFLFYFYFFSQTKPNSTLKLHHMMLAWWLYGNVAG